MTNKRPLNFHEAVELLRSHPSEEAQAFVQDYDLCQEALAESERRYRATMDVMLDHYKKATNG